MLIDGDDDFEERGHWRGKLDFLLSAIGYCIGIGNLWGFPYKAFTNGGASFLFPYLIILATCGIPMFFLESALGQFSSVGPITVWKVAPMFMGIGYAMIIVSFSVCIYYNVLIAWSLYYMLVAFVSLGDHPPWESCDNRWNTRKCHNQVTVENNNKTFSDRLTSLMSCMSAESKSSNFSMETIADTVPTRDVFLNQSMTLINDLAQQCLSRDDGRFDDNDTVPASKEYFEYYFLQEQHSEDIEEVGGVSLKLCMSLLLAWLLVFGSLYKGIQSSGKVVHVTATFPFVVLLIMLIKGVTLEGHMEGIKFYVIPRWHKLLNLKVWREAATQVFFSLGIGFGGLMTLASYNKFQNNIYRDVFLVAGVNSGTSILGGFVIFSVLGHIAHVSKKPIEDIATSDNELAFIAYPEGLSRLPASSFWSLIFFLMLVTLGLDSQFGSLETVLSSLSDLYPRVLRKHKTKFTLCACIAGFLLGIPLATHGGRRVLLLMHEFSGSYNVMVIALAEIICICYVYGINYFRDDIKMMIGFRPKYYWIATWAVITPLAIMFILVTTVVQAIRSGPPDKRPDWATGIGWFLAALPVVVMIAVGFIQVLRYKWPDVIRPTMSWGPALPENRVGRYVQRYLKERSDIIYDFIPISRQTSVNLGGSTSENGSLAVISDGNMDSLA